MGTTYITRKQLAQPAGVSNPVSTSVSGGTVNFATLGDSRLALLNLAQASTCNSITWNGNGSSVSGQALFGFSSTPNWRVGQRFRFVGTTADASTALNGVYTVTQVVTTTSYAVACNASITPGAAAAFGTITNLDWLSDAGWAFWAESLSGQRLKFIYNGGRGGDSAAQASSRVNEITSRTDVNYCFIDVGINDYNTASAAAGGASSAGTITSTTAGVATYIQNICTQLLSANIIPVLLTMYGVSSNFTNAADIMKYVTQHNILLQNIAGSNSRIMIIDQASATTDPTSGYLLGGTQPNTWTPDGLHPARMIGRSVGQLVVDSFGGAKKFPSILTKGLFDNARNSSSNYNVIQNAPWVNSGGTVTAGTAGTNIGTAAQGWYTSRTVSTGIAATFTNGSPNVVITAHGLAVNGQILFLTSGTLPTNFSPSTRYYVVSVVDANTVTLSATQGGVAITAGSVGSGTHTSYRAMVSSVAARTLAADGDAIGYNQVIEYTSQGSSDILEARINIGNDSNYYTLITAGTYELRGAIQFSNVSGSNLKAPQIQSYLSFTDAISSTSYNSLDQLYHAATADSLNMDTTAAGNVASTDCSLILCSKPWTYATNPTGQFSIGIRFQFPFSAAGTTVTIKLGRWGLHRTAT